MLRLFSILFVIFAPFAQAQTPDGPVKTPSIVSTIQVWDSLTEFKDSLPAPAQQKFVKDLKKTGIDFPAVEKIKVSLNTETDKVDIYGDEDEHSLEHLASVGALVGLYMPISYQALYMMRINDGRPFLDVDIIAQPTRQNESEYGVGLSVHPFNHAFYISTHSKVHYLLPPNDPWYNPTWDRVYVQSASMGFRGVMGKDGMWKRLVGTVDVGATWVLSKRYDLGNQPRITLQVGLNYLFWRRQ